MNAEKLIARSAELPFLPVLAYFATRTCPYCYSIGLWRVLLPLIIVWLIFTPIFYLLESIRSSALQNAFYLFSWCIIGLGIGFFNSWLYQFGYEGSFGSFRVALVGGVLLAIFKNNFLLRLKFEQAALGQEASLSEVSATKSLIKSGIHSVITVYTMFTLLLMFALYYYLDSSLNVPQAMRQRAVSNFLFDMTVVFIFHTFFALLISFDAKKTLLLGLQTNLEVLTGFMSGNFGRRVPPFGTNEMGQLGNVVNKVGLELFEKERIRSIFGKYLNSAVASKILNSSEGKLEGETKKVALLFMDIKGFTSLSEKNTPAQTVDWLNSHFNCVVEVIHRYNGIIDKFIGDAVLAYFDSDSSSNPAKDALSATQDLLKNKEMLLPFGIGLHYGTVVAGNIGSIERLEYTIIGDAVNTVTRIEGQTRVMQVQALASAQFVNELGNERLHNCFRELELVTVKGRAEPIQLWGLADVR